MLDTDTWLTAPVALAEMDAPRPTLPKPIVAELKTGESLLVVWLVPALLLMPTDCAEAPVVVAMRPITATLVQRNADFMG